jgi:hypothetical protein
MTWFVRSSDHDDVQRRAAISLLLSLEARLHIGLGPYRAALEAGQAPESVFGDLGQYLAERWFQQNNRIDELESRVFLCEKHTAWLDRENERLRKEPVRERLAQAQAQMQALMGDFQRSEDELSAAHQALEAEQWSRQQEISQRDEFIAAQNRIIAQQQLRLSGMAGETPGAELAGEG